MNQTLLNKLFEAIKTNNQQQLLSCLEQGVQVNDSTTCYSPIHVAAKALSIEATTTLIKHGADVNKLSAERSSALCYTWFAAEGSRENWQKGKLLMQYLIAHGADIHQHVQSGITLCSFAYDILDLQTRNEFVDLACEHIAGIIHSSIAFRTLSKGESIFSKLPIEISHLITSFLPISSTAKALAYRFHDACTKKTDFFPLKKTFYRLLGNKLRMQVTIEQPQYNAWFDCDKKPYYQASCRIISVTPPKRDDSSANCIIS